MMNKQTISKPLVLFALLVLLSLACGFQRLPTPTPTPRSTHTPRPTEDPCAQELTVGCPAPDFTLTTFDGQQIKLADLRGKVVLVSFWSSWSPFCQGDVTSLQAAWQDYSTRGDVLFVGIAYIDTDKLALEFIQQYGLTYPTGPDTGTVISQAYRITGVPEAYIVGKDGNLAFVQRTAFQSADEVRAALEPLLAP